MRTTAWIILFAFAVATTQAAEPTPPKGFRALFNGKNLAGWHGLNPHSGAKLTGEKRKANLAQQRADFGKHWTVKNGELINDGHGPYANTDEDLGDMELLIEYKTVAGADSGIYLRGNPQIQIWDWNQLFNPKRQDRKPHLGSGALHNNKGGGSGREPHVFADAPFGEWNRFRIRQIGAKTWIWLNDKLVVDGYVMENYWDRTKPLPAKGKILLQTHGGEIRWRNIFVREIGVAEAAKILAASSARKKSIAGALSLHASFDGGLDADFARGDRSAYVKEGGAFVRAKPNQDARVDAKAGKFGGALHFTRKSRFRPAYKHPGILNYNTKNWNSTVSVWMRLTPDKDLEPGYCDPIQIIGDTTRKGFIFLEFSKDHTPRHFRYAIRPNIEIWNPKNVGWEDIPAAKRPMVEIRRPIFTREKWTHVAFTLENINRKEAKPSGRLYINGELKGAIKDWNLMFGWNPEAVLLVLGAAYVGHLDDLAVFNRALTAAEVKQVYRLSGGVRSLYAD